MTVFEVPPTFQHVPQFKFQANGLSYSNLQSEFETFCGLFLRPSLSARYVESVVMVHMAASNIQQTAQPVEKWAELQKLQLIYL